MLLVLFIFRGTIAWIGRKPDIRINNYHEDTPKPRKRQ
jgi:hypothetical protein